VAKRAEVRVQGGESTDQRPEHRATVRYFSDGKTACQTLAGWRGDSWEATIRDISQQGLGLLLGRRFELGVILAVELPHSTEASFHIALARVVRVVRQKDGRWLIGCALVHPLSCDELCSLL